MEAVKAAFLYATKQDQEICAELRIFLAPYERSGLMEIEEIDIHVKSLSRQQAARFDVFFCLVSPAFLFFFEDKDEDRNLSYLVKERQVVPVLIRPSLWENGVFKDLQPLPKTGTPVTLWSNHNAAYKEIAIGIKQKAEDIRFEKRSREKELGDYQIEQLLLREEEFFNMVDQFSAIFDQQYEKFQQNEYFWHYFLQRHGYDITGNTRRSLQRKLTDQENLIMREISIQKSMDEIVDFIHELYHAIPENDNRFYCLVIYDLESASYKDYQKYESSFSRNYGKFMTVQENTAKYRFGGKLKIAYKVFTQEEICT
ncbi:MAG: hypothetical protein MRY78_02075 [Saprospiraceae bacterium]|nr:hypothetical protein [Saprospiraceae bacterium]